jgi:hypothetical protein
MRLGSEKNEVEVTTEHRHPNWCGGWVLSFPHTPPSLPNLSPHSLPLLWQDNLSSSSPTYGWNGFIVLRKSASMVVVVVMLFRRH